MLLKLPLSVSPLYVSAVQILRTRVDPHEGFDEFGPLRGGCILLRGHVFAVDLVKIALDIEKAGNPLLIEGDNHYELPITIQLDVSKHADSLPDVPYFCLPIFTFPEWIRPSLVTLFAECLLLEQVRRPPPAGVVGPWPGYTRVDIMRLSLEDSALLGKEDMIDLPKALRDAGAASSPRRTPPGIGELDPPSIDELANSGEVLALY